MKICMRLKEEQWNIIRKLLSNKFIRLFIGKEHKKIIDKLLKQI